MEYSADVRNSASTLPMAVFQSTPLEEDVTLAEHFRATLWVESTSADADLFVALRVMDGHREISYHSREPESQAPLTWGCLKVSLRAQDFERSTTERPWHHHRVEDVLPLSAGDVVRVDLELMAATGRIAAGRCLRTEIMPAEGPAPLPDMNAPMTSPTTAAPSIAFSPEGPSRARSPYRCSSGQPRAPIRGRKRIVI